MKKILLLGGSHRDIPLIKAAQNLGYYVITLGDKNYYIGHKYSNKVYLIDFNNLDEIRKIIIKENIEFLLPGCGEESYINTVKLSHEFHMGNFDSLEVAQLLHNKWSFKNFCLKNNISTPYGIYYDGNLDSMTINYPLVVKPTNLSGGRGVQTVYNKEELEKALSVTQEFSEEVFLEEFIDGQLIAYSIFLKNKKIFYSFLGDDISYLNKYLITTAYPININAKVKKILEDEITKLATLLNLVDGMFHFQVLIKNNRPYIIDITRRIPGDLYPYLIEYNDNIEYSKAVVQAYTTGDISDCYLEKTPSNYMFIRHCIMPNKNGLYTNLFIDNIIKDKIIYQLNLIKLNTVIETYLQSQIAIVFIKIDKTEKDVINNLNKLIYPIIGEI